MKKNTTTKGSKSTTAKKASSTSTKSGKGNTSNPSAMKNPPKKGGSVIAIEPADIEEFKTRKKLAKQATQPDTDDDDSDFIADGFDIDENEDRSDMYEDSERMR
ncbi:MAG: hypothetical protein V4615_16970 [Bacteroidota bacterium]